MVVNSSTWWAQSHLVGPQNDDRQVRAVEGKDRGVGRPVDHLEAPLPPRVVGVSGGEAQLDRGCSSLVTTGWREKRTSKDN